MGTPAVGTPARPGPATVSWLRRFQTGCSRWERLFPGPGAVRLPITPADPLRLLTSTLPAGCRDKGPPRAVGIMSGRSVLYRKVISTLKALLASAVAGEIARRLTQEKTKAGRAASGRFLPRIVLPPAAGSARGLFSSAAHLHAGLHRCVAAEQPRGSRRPGREAWAQTRRRGRWSWRWAALPAVHLVFRCLTSSGCRPPFTNGLEGAARGGAPRCAPVSGPMEGPVWAPGPAL